MKKEISIKEIYPGYEIETKEVILHNILMAKVNRLEGTRAAEILGVLYSHSDPLKLADLQSIIKLTQYKFYEELARLEGAGLIEKKRSSADNRVLIVELTNQALYIMQNIKEEIK